MADELPQAEPENSQAEISQLFEDDLNQHGHAYQSAVARKIREMNAVEDLSKRSFWEIVGTELPVSADRNTHIDLVGMHSHGYGTSNTRYFLVGECKKSDPGYAAWCFAKVPITWGDHFGTYIQFDQVEGAGGDRYYHGNVELRATERQIMGLGKALTTRKPVSGRTKADKDKDAINDAVNQVLRGVGGFINYITSKRQAGIELKKEHVHVVVPAVFTTADIYTTDTNIALADLKKGTLPKNSVRAKKVDWIWYNYNRSSQISHDLLMVGEANPGQSNLFREFTRTVAIVGPDGLESFLRYNFNHKFG